MLRKLSLVAVAALSLGAAALAPTSASAWGGGGWHGGWHGGGGWQCWGGGWHPAAGVADGVLRASMSAAPPITAAMVAAMCDNWSRRPGDRAGAWSTAAINRDR
jgi:hypothetical protein